jgi:GntR family transcriptional regulator
MYHFTIDKNDAKPIYLQIEDYLLREMDDGRLQPGQKIPSANDLSREMGVSRMTVLQALRELTHKGRLFSSVGKGTYVSQSEKLETDMRSVWGFTETFQAQGFKVNSQLINLDHIKADATIAKALGVNEGTPIFRLSRKRLLNDQPVGIETVHLNELEIAGLDQHDWNVESLYEVLREEYGIEPVCGRNYIEAAAADENIARLLCISKNTPVLATSRISCLANQKPVEYVMAYYRSDLIRFKADVTSEPSMNLSTKVKDIIESKKITS